MPLFISDTELEQAAGDISVIVERADAYIHDLLRQLETNKAQADATAISAEQNCSLIEQKFLALSAQFTRLENEKSELSAALERRSTELAQAQAQAHKVELESMKKESDAERLSFELTELRKAKRELLEVVEHKNIELNEKNQSIKTYLEKIVISTDERTLVEGKLREVESEMIRGQAIQARLSQEKELLEQHNAWLNEELTSKVNSLLEERRTSAELEIELHSKLSEAERQSKETRDSLQKCKDQIKDLQLKLNQTREELRFTKDDTAAKEEHLTLEIATASKLADLYKQSSEEWSKKATDLEGVIKALEVHLNQVEVDSKEKLEKEVKAREKFEMEAAEMKEKLHKAIAELEASKTEKDSDSLVLIRSFPDNTIRDSISDQQLALELHGGGPIVPIIPSGTSGTALAAALLRDGWSLTKMYIKYQEAVDAWHHERQGRKNSQTLLERVLHEIEQKAEVIMDERAEHASMVEAYSLMEEKLHLSMAEQMSLENSIRELKAELKKKERELKSGQREISDLHTQVAVLLKECTDIRKQYGVTEKYVLNGDRLEEFSDSVPETTPSDKVISDRLLAFKDIHGMVEHNSQLRALVRSLAQQNEQREMELKETFDLELKKRTDEAARKVATILRKSEEQSGVIESLQGIVGMYKRLYEEGMKSHSNHAATAGILSAPSDDTRHDFRRLLESSQEEVQKAREEVDGRLRSIEEELSKAKQEATLTRSERDRLIVEAAYAREQLQTIMKEAENHRREMDAILGRNVEFSQTITGYQRRLRENAERVHKAEDSARRLSIEVSVLEREKELIVNAEKRASQEVSSLSNRVHRLQAALDNIQTAEEAREAMRFAEKKKLEEDVNRMQKEWAEMKHELDLERTHVKQLIKERDQAIAQAMERVEAISRELADALRSVSEAEIRARVAEARCTELDTRLEKADDKILAALTGGKKLLSENGSSSDPHEEALSLLEEAREQIEQLKEDLDGSKAHVEQYKKIAEVNEDALKQIEDAFNIFKAEAAKMKEALQLEVSSLRKQLTELEEIAVERERREALIVAEKEKYLNDAVKEITSLKDSDSSKQALLEQADERIRALKDEVDKQHQLWRTAQNNYERQVLLQADTIKELTRASEKLTYLEEDVLRLRMEAETAEADLKSSQVTWEMEKETLVARKMDVENKLKELDDQNTILLDRLEAMHITMAEQERKAGEVAEGPSHALQGECNLQDIIRYLRRSKETADTEISLLKQERLRLQKQLEAALRAAEDAQANLRREHENARASLCSDEEFRSLQAQVREMNLLRESNAQLREENRHNFEDCRESREREEKAQREVESLTKLLREREIELEAAGKELEIQKAEILRWQNRVSQILEKFKTVDVEDYEQKKIELAEIQEATKATRSELEETKKEAELLQGRLLKQELEASLKDEKIAELEKRLQDTSNSEANFKAEAEKYKKHVTFMKRKIDTITKEREELLREKETLLKQIEELKINSGKRSTLELPRSEALIRQEIASQHEQAQRETDNLLKEKETRIQSLERTLEREREDLRKEREELRNVKARRQKDQKTFFDAAQKAAQERNKLLEEINLLRQEKDQNLEKTQVRKTGRKLIRPKIEPAGQQETQAEPIETVMETVLEGSEVESELPDENKAVVTTGSEALESASVTTALLSTSFRVSATEIAPIKNQTTGTPTTMAIVPVLPGPRKRTSSSEEFDSEQEAKTDALPLPKKQRGFEVVMVEPDTTPLTVNSSTLSVELLKGEMEVEEGASIESEDVERSEFKTVASEPGIAMIAEVSHVAESIHNVGSARSEAPLLKRARIARPDSLVASHQADAVAQKEDGGLEDRLEDKIESRHLEGTQEAKKEGTLNEGDYLGEGKTDFVPGDTNETVMQSGDQVLTGFYQSLHGNVGIETSVHVGTPEKSVWVDTENTDHAEGPLVESNDRIEADETPTEVPVSCESPGGVKTPASDGMLELYSGSEGIAIVVDAAADVEEGEIEPDTLEDEGVASVFQSNPLENEEESKDNSSLDDVGKTIELSPLKEATTNWSQQPEEARKTEKPEVSSAQGDSFHQAQLVDISSGTTGTLKVDATGVAERESVTSQINTRQSTKNATIYLAEKARDRVLVRKSGLSPPSPGARGRARGLKSIKRTGGVQRGRAVSSGAQAQGEEVDMPQATTGESPSIQGSQPAATSNKFDALDDEQDQK